MDFKNIRKTTSKFIVKLFCRIINKKSLEKIGKFWKSFFWEVLEKQNKIIFGKLKD